MSTMNDHQNEQVPDGERVDEQRPDREPDAAGATSESGEASHDDDPQGMRGQLDDSMNGLEPGHDVDEASRGIPQE